MVLLIAKNFQLVKFSQANFGIKNPASQRAKRLVLGYSVSAGTGQIVQGDCSEDGCDAKSELCFVHKV